jgi:hypothetical protein
VSSDLEEVLTERRDLGASKSGSCGLAPDLLHEDIGGCGEGDPELVGPETRAARPVHLEAVMELLDPILDFTTPAVDLFVDPLRSLGEG